MSEQPAVKPLLHFKVVILVAIDRSFALDFLYHLCHPSHIFLVMRLYLLLPATPNDLPHQFPILAILDDS